MHKKRPYPSERVERRISAATSITLCALTIFLQIGTTLLLTRYLQEYSTYAYSLLELMGVIVAIGVYQRPGSPSYKLVWMCLLLALPVAGMILFFLWGGARQAKSLSMKTVSPVQERESVLMGCDANLGRLKRQSSQWGKLATYLQKRGFLLHRNTNVK